jgi:multiple sugar transport system permease protein
MHLRTRDLALSLGPSLAVLIGMVAYPTVYVLVLSFKRYDLTNPFEGQPFVGLDNYKALLADPAFQSALSRSIMFTVASVVLTLVLGMAIALLLHRRDIYGTGAARTIILIPIILTPMVIGAMFRFILDYDNGLIDTALPLLGLPRIPFLAHAGWALASVILVDVWQWTPFVALVLLAGLEALPKDPYEAAQVDGASRWGQLRHITLPLLAPVITLVLLLRTMDAFREFDKVYIMTGGGPGIATQTLPIYIWRAAFENFNMGFAAAIGEIMLILITIVSIIYVKRLQPR